MKTRLKDVIKQARERNLDVHLHIEKKEYCLQIRKRTKGPDNRILKFIWSKKRKQVFKKAIIYLNNFNI